LFSIFRNSIVNNSSTLQNEADEKDYKLNHYLRDLELKNIHIESIENILKRKDEEIEKLSYELVHLKNLMNSGITNKQNLNEDDHFKSTFGSKNTFNTEEREHNFNMSQNGTIQSQGLNNLNSLNMNNISNMNYDYHSSCQCTPGVIVTSRFSNEASKGEIAEKQVASVINSGFNRNEESEKELKNLISQYNSNSLSNYSSKECDNMEQKVQDEKFINCSQESLNQVNNQAYEKHAFIVNSKHTRNISMNRINELNSSLSSQNQAHGQSNFYSNKSERIPGKIYSIKK
jgi:hypothetical protein